MPAEPQHSAASGMSTTSSSGIVRSTARGWVRTCWRVPEVAGVVVGDPGADRVPRGARAAVVERSSSTSCTSRTLALNSFARSRPLGVVGEQVAVVLHRRPAAGDVGDTWSTSRAARTGRSSRRARASASSSRPACSSSAPQHCWARGASTSQPSAASTRTVASLTRWKNTSWTHPVSSATVARRSPDGGGALGQPRERLAQRHRRQQRLQRAQPAGQLRRERRAPAGSRRSCW